MLNYPLKFDGIYLEKIWGGSRLNSVMHKHSHYPKTGESWEVSTVKGKSTVVINGALAGKTLREICETHPEQLLGNELNLRFNGEFPLLIKFLDAQVPLSVQVHPNDDLAKIYDSFGKNEMWYILAADENSAIYLGFEEDETEISIKEAIEKNELLNKIKSYQPQKGDVYDVPAGTVHAIGGGVLLVEIQQTSDITFRMYDWDRMDDDGKPRDLHLEEGLKALNYNATPDLHSTEADRKDEKLVHNAYFKVNKLDLHSTVERDTRLLNSFVVYMFLKGDAKLTFGTEEILIEEGGSVLIPYALGEYEISSSNAECIEVYV